MPPSEPTKVVPRPDENLTPPFRPRTDRRPRTDDLLLYRRLRQLAAGSAPADAVAALLEAVRAHQVLTKNRAVPRRPADHALYREAGLA